MQGNNAISQAPEYSSSYRYVMAFTAFFSQISLAICLGALSPLGPYIRESLGMSYAQFGLLFTLCNAGTMIFLWITGPLVDKFGIRKILVGGTVLMALGLFTASLTTTAVQLIALQLCLGICNSIAGPTGSKIISTWIGPKQRNFMMGLRQAGIPVTSILAGFGLPLIAAQGGWRMAYVVISVCVLAVGIIAGILYRDSSVMKEISSNPAQRSNFKENMADFFKRDFILLSVGCLLMMGTQFALSSNMSNYCSGVFAKSGLEGASAKILAGQIYSYACIAGIVGRLLFGWMADRFSAKKTLMGINVGAAVLLLILGLWGAGMDIFSTAVMMILYGFTGFAWTGVQLGMACEMSSIKATATAIGVTLSFSFFGMMIFPPVFGSIVDAGGFSNGWFFLAVFTLIGVLILLPIREKKLSMDVQESKLGAK